MNKVIGAIAIVILGLSGMAYSDDVSPNSTDLVKVKKGVLKETWVNPETDLTKYTKIMIADGEFEYRDVKKGPRFSGHSHSNKSEFWIADKDRERAEEMITKAFGTEMAKIKNFEIVDSAGPDTLILRGGLKDIVSHIPPDLAGPNRTYVRNIGTATVVLEAVDSTTGAVVFNASERSTIERFGGEMIEANRVAVNSELRRWTHRIASKLVKGLDAIHS